MFLQHALMEHGTLWGHGAYLGPDYTAEHLHRQVGIARDVEAAQRFGRPYASLAAREQGAVAAAVRAELKTNRYDPATRTLAFSPGEAAATRALQAYWGEYFGKERSAPGLAPGSIGDPEEIRLLNAYFSWATWATVANRPGLDYTYTNNWPYDPDAGNHPSTQAYVWSALSLVTLLGGLGLVLLLFGKFHYLGWGGEEGGPSGDPPAPLRLTSSQLATGKYFTVVALLFLLQALVGGALAHYRVEPFSFYGLDAIVRLAPYNLLRTWHLQLAIFWIATAWVAGGLFLAPLVGGGDPPGQRRLVDVLFWALVLVVGGSLAGEFLGDLRPARAGLVLAGAPGVGVPRPRPVLAAAPRGRAGCSGSSSCSGRCGPRIRREGKSDVSALFLYAAAAIPLFYLPALFYGPRTNFAVIDNWRFWIIHLWVEGFFELFATVLVAIMFRQLGLVTTRTATRLVYLDAILFLAGGIVGTGHHWYFTGQGTLNMGLAACFSALEVVPLTLLTLDASGFIRLHRQARRDDADQPGRQAPVGHLLLHRRGRLELRRRRRLRLPHQHAHRLLLRGGHHPDRQPWPRGHVRRVRHAGARRADLLPPGHAGATRPGAAPSGGSAPGSGGSTPAWR